MNSVFVIFFLSNTTSSILFDDLLEELVMLLKVCSLESFIFKKVFGFGCALSRTLSWMRYICFLPFIWLPNARSSIFDKTNLFLGGRQTQHFANFVPASSAKSL